MGNSITEICTGFCTVTKMKLVFLLFVFYISRVYSTCNAWKGCNGHGRCNGSTSSCVCDPGWGALTDITIMRSPDCSWRTCPAGKAWGSIPTKREISHSLAECSGRGKCNRESGQCECEIGYTGGACQRKACPNNCSGHGRCVSMKNMARLSNAQPLSANTYYSSLEVLNFSAFLISD